MGHNPRMTYSLQDEKKRERGYGRSPVGDMDLPVGGTTTTTQQVLGHGTDIWLVFMMFKTREVVGFGGCQGGRR